MLDERAARQAADAALIAAGKRKSAPPVSKRQKGFLKSLVKDPKLYAHVKTARHASRMLRRLTGGAEESSSDDEGDD